MIQFLLCQVPCLAAIFIKLKMPLSLLKWEIKHLLRLNVNLPKITHGCGLWPVANLATELFSYFQSMPWAGEYFQCSILLIINWDE
jgi:hypothetical protein